LEILKKILPRIPEDLRINLTETLPSNQQVALQHALQFIDQTVGAYMNTHVLFLPMEHTVEQTLELMRKFSEEITPWIFCIDHRGELQGMITLTDILIAPPTQQVSHIMKTCPLVLSADTPISTIAFDAAWEVYGVLPVINEQRILLGILEYHKIVHQIQSLLQSDRKENLVDSFAQMIFMFSHTTEDILNEISQLSTHQPKNEKKS
jgi:magnesium transporter